MVIGGGRAVCKVAGIHTERGSQRKTLTRDSVRRLVCYKP